MHSSVIAFITLTQANVTLGGSKNVCQTKLFTTRSNLLPEKNHVTVISLAFKVRNLKN